MQDSSERYVRHAILIMLSLAAVAAGAATLIHWFSPIRQPLDLIVPPTMFVLFAGLLIALMRRPRWVSVIGRAALLAAGLALVAPTWLYTLQATLTPGLQLIGILPPISMLLLILVIMVMLFFPARQAFRMALLGWVLIALPVLAYLFAHPEELWTPRGEDLLMSYGPGIIMVAVLIPVQRGLTGKIERLVSERARMEVMIRRDPLTGIHNRRHGEQVLRDLLAGQAPAGVIMFDIDRFKTINDVHGHPVGDRVLQVVAQRCQGLLRKGECVSRWGGEEFLVVVPEIDAPGLQRTAERLRCAIARSPIESVQQVTASFGVALIRRGDSLTGLLQRVDQALYQAKQRGGDCVASSLAGNGGD